MYNACVAIDPDIGWADKVVFQPPPPFGVRGVNTMSKLVPVSYILLAVGMISLAGAYRIASGSAAGSLLISLAVVVWVIILLEPTSKIGLYASGIVVGTLALVTMAMTALGLDNVVFRWGRTGSSGPATAGYILILLFGIFYLVGEILNMLNLDVGSNDLYRASIGVAGTGFLLGGIAGILLFAAFIATSAKLPSRARRR